MKENNNFYDELDEIQDETENTNDFDDLDDYIEQPVRPKRTVNLNRPILVTVQLVLCVLVLAAAFIFKSIGGEFYNQIHDWYFACYNDSVFTDGKINLDFLNADKNKSSTEESKEKSNSESSIQEAFESIYAFPLAECAVTSSYGERTRDSSTAEFHKGTDFAAKLGEEIYSMTDGTVITAEESSSYGKYVIVQQNDETFLYAHCSELCVSKGDIVHRGDVLAKAGETGDANGVHLHLEITKNGEVIDPAVVLEAIDV